MVESIKSKDSANLAQHDTLVVATKARPFSVGREDTARGERLTSRVKNGSVHRTAQGCPPQELAAVQMEPYQALI